MEMASGHTPIMATISTHILTIAKTVQQKYELGSIRNQKKKKTYY
jgi:hypothetical protein